MTGPAEPVYLSPLDVDFYVNHETAVLESLAERLTGEGAFVAATSGADHPVAKELAKMLAAVLGALLIRDLDKLIADNG